MANYDRRLNRLEEVLMPKGRQVVIWDDHKPGSVEREIARLIEAGSIGAHDEIVTVSWRTPKEAA